jgi:PAS domain S-box-containing protein
MSEPSPVSRYADEALPPGLTLPVLLLTPAPLIVVALGAGIDLGPSAGLVHSLMEWTAVSMALFTFGLGILAWKARPDPLLFIITLAALLSGLSDSAHTMSTSELLGYSGRFEDFVQWSGALGRLFRALALSGGASYLLWFHRENRSLSWRTLAALAVPAAAFLFVLQWLFFSGHVPDAALEGSVARKPWDFPLLVLIVATGVLSYFVNRLRPSLLAKALLLASLPEAAASIHYVFGLRALFDGHFFSAHALKLLSSLAPLVAVSLHLARSHRRESEAVESMRKLVKSLELAEDELRSKEIRLNQLTQNIKEVFWIAAPNGSRMHYVSPAYKDIFGSTEAELYRQPYSFLKVIHPEDRQKMVDVMSQGGTNDFELDYRILRPEGEVRWLRTRGFPIRNEAGEVYRLAGVTEDVTDRKRAEDELRRSEARIRALLRAMPDLMFRLSRTGVFLDYYAPPGSRLYRPPSVFLGSTVRKVLGDELAERFEGAIEEALATGVVQTVEYRLPHDGCDADYEARFAPSSDDEVLLVVRDVTEQKRLQKEILEISNREQEHFGHDLHDGLAQHLMGIALLCRVLQTRLDKELRPEAEQARQIEKLVDEALSQTRSLARGLAPVEIEAGGLEAALEELARRVEGIHGVRCVFRGESRGETGGCAEALHVYRIAQEAVSNALRHAHAEHITIDLQRTNGRRRLTVADDGVGIGSRTASTPRNGDGVGMGLHIMRYRARMIDAVFDVRPASRRGTVVSCEWSSTPESVRPLQGS